MVVSTESFEHRPSSITDIPRLDGIIIDGSPDDWNGRGFEVGVLDHDGVIRDASDLDAGFRLGWDQDGLLLLVRVSDNLWYEAEEGVGFFSRDSIQLFLSTSEGGRIELAVSPGMSPAYTEPRMHISDLRQGENPPPVDVEMKRSRTNEDYLLEMRLPWSNFQPVPKAGDEIGFMLIVNDSDGPRDRFAPRWAAGAENDWRNGKGMRLAEQASESVNMIIGSLQYERFRRAVLTATAVARFAGREVELRDGARLIGNATLDSDATRATCVFILPMPPRGKPFGPLTLSVADGPEVTLTPPNADESRAIALMNAQFHPERYLLTSDELPACDFSEPSFIEDVIGPYTIRVAWFDAEFNPVISADKPGRYGAIAEVVTDRGVETRRFRTVFRSAASGGGGQAARINAEFIAGTAGIGEAAVAARSNLLNTLNRAMADGLARAPETAILMAGLRETAGEDTEWTVYTNPVARDRQWWVTARRRFLELDRRFDRPVPAPLTVEAGDASPALEYGSPEEAGMNPDITEALDALCKEWAEKSGEPFAVCLARRGIVFHHRAYGNIGDRPMELSDRRNIASIPKILGGMLMMRLDDAGLLDIDDPISKYLPSWPEIPGRKPITIRDLYTHTAGFSGRGFITDEVNDADESAAIYAPYLEPHSRFEYATTSYTLAGKIIENVSGMSVPEFYRRHLLEPLGCSNTDALHMGFGVRTTSWDLAVIGQTLINRGAYENTRLMSEENFGRMLPAPLTYAFGPETDQTWGIGMRYYRIPGLSERVAGHNSGSMSTFRVDLENELIIVMTRNTMGRFFSDYHQEFIRSVVEAMIE